MTSPGNLGSTTMARSNQARSQDTLRWGSVLSVPFGASTDNSKLAFALQTARSKQGSQLVNGHWRWPLSWRVGLLLTPNFSPGEVGGVNVTFEITIGSGDGQMLVTRQVAIPPSAVGIYFSAIDNALALPACDILVQVASVTVNDSTPLDLSGALLIGAFVAPETEPHAMLEVLACMCRLEGANGAPEGVDHRQGDWMPPGFHPEELGYRR